MSGANINAGEAENPIEEFFKTQENFLATLIVLDQILNNKKVKAETTFVSSDFMDDLRDLMNTTMNVITDKEFDEEFDEDVKIAKQSQDLKEIGLTLKLLDDFYKISEMNEAIIPKIATSDKKTFKERLSTVQFQYLLRLPMLVEAIIKRLKKGEDNDPQTIARMEALLALVKKSSLSLNEEVGKIEDFYLKYYLEKNQGLIKDPYKSNLDGYIKSLRDDKTFTRDKLLEAAKTYIVGLKIGDKTLVMNQVMSLLGRESLELGLAKSPKSITHAFAFQASKKDSAISLEVLPPEVLPDAPPNNVSEHEELSIDSGLESDNVQDHEESNPLEIKPIPRVVKQSLSR